MVPASTTCPSMWSAPITAEADLLIGFTAMPNAEPPDSARCPRCRLPLTEQLANRSWTDPSKVVRIFACANRHEFARSDPAKELGVDILRTEIAAGFELVRRAKAEPDPEGRHRSIEGAVAALGFLRRFFPRVALTAGEQTEISAGIEDLAIAIRGIDG